MENSHKYSYLFTDKISQLPFNFPLFTAILFLIALIFFSPKFWIQFDEVNKLDPSFVWALSFAKLHKYYFGKDFIWTYGPLGFISSSYILPSFHLWLLASIIKGFEYFLLIYLIYNLLIRKLSINSMVSLTFSIFFSFFFLSILNQSFEISAVFFANAILIWFLRLKDKFNWMWLILFLLHLSISSLIKGNVIIPSFIINLVYVLSTIFQKGKFVILKAFCIFIISIALWLALWLISGQNILYLPDYFKGMIEIVGGYASTMSLNGVLWRDLLGIFILILLLLIIFRSYKNCEISLIDSIFLLIPLLLYFKQGFTRHDPGLISSHSSIFFIFAEFIIIILYATTKNSKDKTLLGFYFFILLIFLGVTNIKALPKWDPESFQTQLKLAISSFHRNKFILEERSRLKAIYSLPDSTVKQNLNSPTTVLPSDLTISEAYGFPILIPPIPQLYSVYTTKLDETNLIWFLRHQPQRIIYSFSSIDNRYPLFDAPLTQQQIIFNYQLQTVLNSNYSLFIPKETKFEKKIIYNKEINYFEFNKEIPIPQDSQKLRFAKVFVEPNLLYRIIELVYRPPIIYFNFILIDGSRKGPFRFTFPTAKDGILISHFINNLDDFHNLTSGCLKQNVKSIQIVVSNFGKFFYSSNIGMQFGVVGLK